jgi:hypothetical protein
VSSNWQRVLQAFFYGWSLNRFEAVCDLRDWCLHTTVASFDTRGFRINRTDERVLGHFGAVCCKRYRLDPGSRPRTAALLGHTEAHHDEVA